MSDWDDVIRRIDADARFRARMAVTPQDALHELRLSFPDEDRSRLSRYARDLMASRGERVDSATPDPGREAEQDRLRELPMPGLPEDHREVTLHGPLDTGAGAGAPIPTGGTVPNPFPAGPENIPFSIPGTDSGEHRNPAENYLPRGRQPERHPEIDEAIDRAVHPEQPIDPSMVHDPLAGLHGALSRTSVDGFATAIANVRGQTQGDALVVAVILLFTALGDALYHDPEHNHGLTEERAEWARLQESVGAPARFAVARDRLLTTADDLHAALVPWIGHPLPPSVSEQFARLLVHGSREGRDQLAYLTEQAVREFDEVVSALAGAANDSAAIAAGVSAVLDRADHLFHGSEWDVNPAVAAESAAWLSLGTEAADGTALDTARDQIVDAAHEFTRSLDSHLHRLVDDATRTGLLQPLAHVCAQAREHVRH